MKKISLNIIFFLSIAGIVLSQWQPDMRLTYNGAQSYLSGPSQHDISSNGNTIHIAWFDERNGNWNIYYIRSTNAGVTWEPEIRMTSYPANAFNPSIEASGNLVYLFWDFYRDGNWEIYYCRSIDGGANWSTETRFTNDPAQSGVPHVHASGSNVHVVWYDNRDGNFEIYYKRSTNDGINWGTDTRLTNYSGNSVSPSMAVSGSNLHIVWCEDKDGNYEIYYKRSTDAGISWGADTRLSSTPNISELTSVGVSGSYVYVVWQDTRDGSNLQIYYRRSTDAGATWGTETRLTNNTSYAAAPNITASGSNVHVTWQDNRDGNFEVYYRRSIDLGASWGPETRLTNAGGNSLRTSTSVSGSSVNLVFMDERDGNWEIYYKKDPTGNPEQPPQVPVLVRPLNNSTGMPLTDTLVWNPVAGAVTYRLQIAADAGFSTIILNDSTLTSTTRIVSGLSQLTTYYWRVNAKNSGGTSGWSSVWNFRTKGIPTIVTLLLPPNNAANIPTTYTFRWSKAYDQTTHLFVSNYWFERVTDTISMANLLRDSTLTDTSRVVTGMSNNTAYFWRVKAKNEIGWGNFAAWFKFTTVLVAPSVPILIAPPNGSYNQPSTVRFTWNKSLYAVTYRLQVALDSQFTNIVVNDSTIADSTILVANLTVNRYYWWRVNAKNTVGTSPYSAVWKFGTFFVGLKELSSEIPKEFKLFNNYPNPFNPVTKIKFDLPKADFVTIKIFDVLGRETTTLVNEELNPGTYQADFDGTNYPSGVYYYRLITDNFTGVKKMVLLK